MENIFIKLMTEVDEGASLALILKEVNKEGRRNDAPETGINRPNNVESDSDKIGVKQLCPHRRLTAVKLA